jgi:hypothetical protein
MPCPACQPISREEAEALAWEELLDWVNLDKLNCMLDSEITERPSAALLAKMAEHAGRQ